MLEEKLHSLSHYYYLYWHFISTLIGQIVLFSTDGFVDTMFNIDNDGCEALKNLTIENVKSAKGASDRCLKIQNV